MMLKPTRPSVASAKSGSSRRMRVRGSLKRWTPVPKGVDAVLTVVSSVLRAPLRANRFLALDAEVGGEDAPRRGSGGLRAEPAALDRHGHHDAGVVVRRQYDVPRLVSLRAALGGPRLAGHRDRE